MDPVTDLNDYEDVSFALASVLLVFEAGLVAAMERKRRGQREVAERGREMRMEKGHRSTLVFDLRPQQRKEKTRKKLQKTGLRPRRRRQRRARRL